MNTPNFGNIEYRFVSEVFFAIHFVKCASTNSLQPTLNVLLLLEQ